MSGCFGVLLLDRSVKLLLRVDGVFNFMNWSCPLGVDELFIALSTLLGPESGRIVSFDAELLIQGQSINLRVMILLILILTILDEILVRVIRLLERLWYGMSIILLPTVKILGINQVLRLEELLVLFLNFNPS